MNLFTSKWSPISSVPSIEAEGILNACTMNVVPKSARITVTSNDPSSPAMIAVNGDAPSGRLAVSGSTMFGGVKCCRREERRVAICNVGDCPLEVRRVYLGESFSLV